MPKRSISITITIEIMTGNFRTIRGRTVVSFIGEETPFWRDDESANPAEEVISAVTPGMATIPNALSIFIGSPYRRAGVAFQAWSDHFGCEGSPVVVFQASSQTMNPTIPDSVIARASRAIPSGGRVVGQLPKLRSYGPRPGEDRTRAGTSVAPDRQHRTFSWPRVYATGD
jgi:hypothetical protein